MTGMRAAPLVTEGEENARGSSPSSLGNVRGGHAWHKEGGELVMNKFKYEQLDSVIEKWLAKCAIKRLHEQFDLDLI